MLVISDIIKEYHCYNGKVRALDGVGFTVANGEILGITGKSGSGKTSLLKIIRGIETFEHGSIELDGHKITPDMGEEGGRYLQSQSAIHLQRNFGLWNGPAFENIVRRLNALKTGDEGLPEPESPDYEELKDEAMLIMKLVGLEHKALHSANLLSGGEKQRLILARQLAAKPRLLLLDEPVTMTGPGTKQEILDLIKDLKHKLDIPIIVVSHLPEIHMYLCDRVMCLENGKVTAIGEPQDVLKHFMKDIAEQVELVEVKEKKAVIKVRGLSHRYVLLRVGEVLKFTDLSMDIYAGEITALVGQSGAGKTTLLRIIEGLRTPNEGSICYLHEGQWLNILEFTRQRLDLRKKISIMHQEFTLSPNSTVREQMAFRLRLKGKRSLDYAREKAVELGISDQVLDTLYCLPDMSEDEKDLQMRQMNLSMDIYARLFPFITKDDVDEYAKDIFEALDLPMSILDKTPTQISGGEHVRAFIALALISHPEILILDEPFGDLDPITLRDVTNSLKRINSRMGTTMILVSHHMDFVKEVAHRALLIDNAQIIMDAKPEEVCEQLISMSNATYLR